MAEARIVIKEDEFCCAICLDLLTEPVTLSCGHSFCMFCITQSWDQSPGIYTCPQCRKRFNTRPDLGRNNMLAGVVEKLQETTRQQDHFNATSGDVECDICLASYCEDHFRPHKESSALRKHAVIEASAKLLEKTCPQHERPRDVFCRTDQTCICYLCTLDEHSGHNVVSAVAERAQKEKQIIETQNNYTQRILEREGDHRELVENLDAIKHSAEIAVDDAEKMFKELIQSIERKCSEVTHQIRAQETEEVNRTKEHLKQVDQEIVELESQNKELKQLSQTKDNILFFQIFHTVNDLSLPKAIPRVNINMPHLFQDTKVFVHKLKEHIDNTKLCPDSASQTSSHQIVIKTTTPATQSQPVSVVSTTPATQPQPVSVVSTTPATQSQPVPGFTKTPATRTKPILIIPATQSPPVPGFTKTSDTIIKPIFKLTTPATQPQPQPVPEFTKTPATRTKPIFIIPATESPPVPGFTKTSDTIIKRIFKLTTPATQPQPVPGFTKTPATRTKPIFIIPATESPPVPGFTKTSDTIIKPIFKLTTPATQPQPVTEFTKTPATRTKPIFIIPATESPPVPGFTKTSDTIIKPIFKLTTPATQPQPQPVPEFTKTPATRK